MCYKRRLSISIHMMAAVMKSKTKARKYTEPPLLKEAQAAFRKPPRLDNQMLKRIERYVEKGLPMSTVCALVGIREQQYYNWFKWGNEYLKADEESRKRDFTQNAPIYAYMVTRVQRALALFEKRKYEESLNTKSYAANWIRDLKLLQIRVPENWAEDGHATATDSAFDKDEKFL